MPLVTAPAFDTSGGLYGVNYLAESPGAQAATTLANTTGVHTYTIPDPLASIFGSATQSPPTNGVPAGTAGTSLTGGITNLFSGGITGLLSQFTNWIENGVGRAALIILGVVIIGVAISLLRSNKLEVINAKK